MFTRNDDRLLPEVSISQMLGLGRDEMENMISRGLPYVVIKEKRFFFESDIFEWAKENRLLKDGSKPPDTPGHGLN